MAQHPERRRRAAGASSKPRLAAALVFGALILGPGGARADASAELRARVARVLKSTPLIDGHNDLPWEIRTRFGSDLDRVDLSRDTRAQAGSPVEGPANPFRVGALKPPPLMTDIPRLRAGGVGGQFWSVYIPAEVTGPRAVEMTLEQIDLVKRMAERHPRDLVVAETADEVLRAHRAGRIACLIGIEGGHQIDADLAVLRQMRAAGALYMTLTHFRNTPFADSATDAPQHDGLTPFGRSLVREMNRADMLVDLSHVSAKTMRDALEVARAPVIFSHSGAYAVDPSPRNVPDDVLRRVARNGGVVMVNFYPGYVSDAVRRWSEAETAENARLRAAGVSEEAVRAGLEAWRAGHPQPRATLSQVADHIEHIRDVAGVDHVGLGSDFDGIESTPDGLDGVDKFPLVLVELARRGWSDADLAKVAGRNILRVMRRAAAASVRLRAEGPASQERLEGASATGS